MPTISFNVSPAAGQRVLEAFDATWPEDAPHDVAKAKQRIWKMVAVIVKAHEWDKDRRAVPEPAEIPVDDGA